MKIELHEIPVRDVAEGYIDNDKDGCCTGYGGKLNIRPAFQREFIYDDDKRKKVINTVRKNFPLNVMYWIRNDSDTFEMLDGQQRTISLCQYVHDIFSIDSKLFSNLTKPEQEIILNYKLMIYICDGDDKEKLDWFRIINVAGIELAPQEMRNAVYTGTWLADAKRRFSKTNCPAFEMAKDYLSGSSTRQDYLETALKWIAKRDNMKTIEDYMSKHQHDKNANELWLYFQNVINWVKVIFPKYRREMKGLEWGFLYERFQGNNYDVEELEKKIITLMEDDDVTRNSGIYEYLLGGEEKCLSIRKFTPRMIRAAYERQKGICVKCGKHFEINEMHADHITPWSKGGRTTAENCNMLCAACNRSKSNK